MWRRTCTLARAALSVRFPSRSTCTVPQCSLGAIRYMPSPVRRELSTGKAIVQTIRKRENLEESVDAFKEKRVDYGESENGVVKERVDYGENLEETRRGNNGRGVEEEVPSTRQLFYHALRRGIPMIGFGAMDNFVMINAGEVLCGVSLLEHCIHLVAERVVAGTCQSYCFMTSSFRFCLFVTCRRLTCPSGCPSVSPPSQQLRLDRYGISLCSGRVITLISCPF